MTNAKCTALKAELSTLPTRQRVPIERFFDGNDDPGSIGCNLTRHPGIEVFPDVLTGLLRRPDVEAVHAEISELDPGEGIWPFADTVIVVGAIPTPELRRAVATLQPDEIGSREHAGGSPVQFIWWD